MEAARSSCSIRALPDPLLSAIFALAGRSEGTSISLVSKRWRRCFFTSPDLWRSFELQPPPPSAPHAAAWLAAKRMLLRRVGGFLEDVSLLCFENGSPGMDLGGGEGEAGAAHRPSSTAAVSGPTIQLATLLDSLQPQLLPQLNALAIDCEALPAGASAALRQLGGLRTLVLFVRGPPAIPAEVVQTVAQSLGLLSSLELATFAAPMPDLQQLTQLSGLVALAVAEGQAEDAGEEEAPAGPALAMRQAQPLQPPPPAAFPALEVCLLSSRPHRMQLAGHRLHSLQLLHGEQGGHVLLVSGLRSPAGAGLATLLGAALPPARVAFLTECSFDRSSLRAGQLRGTTTLAPIRDLSLVSYRGRHLEAVLAELLPQAPRLATLRVIDCLAASVPACVQRRSGLQALFLSWNPRLRALPEGPYLAELRELCLFGCGFRALPPAVTTASALTALSLAHTEAALTLQDVDLLATRLPQLRQLKLLGFEPDSTRTPAGVLHDLRTRLPQLEIL